MPQLIYSARWNGPLFIEQGKAEQFELDVERAGSPASITSGTLTIYNQSGDKVIAATAGTVSGGTFIFPAIGSTVFDDSTLGPNFIVQVDLIIGTDGTFRFTNDMVLCKAQLWPTIGQTDLIDRHSEAANLLGAAVASLQPYIDGAWADIKTRLYVDGVHFWKWRTATATRQVLFDRAFELLFFDYATLMNSNDRYMALAEHYSGLYERDWERLKSKADLAEDNTLEDEIKAASPVIMLSSGARRRFR